MKQPVPQRPNQKPGARGGDDEEERFWQKQKNKGRAGGKPMSGVHNTEEAKFFSMCRNRMPKPQYLELLKCLNLYSQQIVDRSELLTLVHDLFKRSSPDLFSSFRKLLGYSGGGALPERDAPSPPTALQPPSAEGGNFRDLDFTTMRRHGTSYRILPDTYAMPPRSQRAAPRNVSPGAAVCSRRGAPPVTGNASSWPSTTTAISEPSGLKTGALPTDALLTSVSAPAPP